MKLQLNGREAYAYTGGRAFDAALPCIVFVHGAINDHSVWTLLARWFAHHGHAVRQRDDGLREVNLMRFNHLMEPPRPC